jgi:hypothetical protein
MYDDNLAHNERYQNLREQLTGVVHREEAEAIIGDFHREKWEFCPLELTFDMDVNLHGTRVIPPFCSKIKLFDKGGTASVYWVAVQKDLISDSALILALHDSLYVDKKFGEVGLPAMRYKIARKLMSYSVTRWCSNPTAATRSEISNWRRKHSLAYNRTTRFLYCNT